MPAIDVEPAAELIETSMDGLGLGDLQTRDLDVQASDCARSGPLTSTAYAPAWSVTRSTARRRHASVDPGPLGRSTRDGADRRKGPYTSPETISCSVSSP